VHPHRNGRVYVSLTRADFMALVSTCAAQYSYKISPSSEELKVACRWDLTLVVLTAAATQNLQCMFSYLAGVLRTADAMWSVERLAWPGGSGSCCTVEYIALLLCMCVLQPERAAALRCGAALWHKRQWQVYPGVYPCEAWEC
jgi:hypothetical protein